ncbi:Conserved hypothetical protein [Prochlorococcus marinus str. MIT 9303]|uniref:Uncharacterized protein n=1 Tax=Prochlorococcus marinus (strain MIT 9303) TaxID=59922 RepID=A2C757_PROM3|nr:Conserved hypothetical protein [Prochlorococcus marinus str. MIT 9303]
MTNPARPHIAPKSVMGPDRPSLINSPNRPNISPESNTTTACLVHA